MRARGDVLVPVSQLDHEYEGFLKSRFAQEDEEDILPGFAHIAVLEDSTATPPTCPKTCPTCLQHYRPRQWQRWEWLEYDCIWSDEEAADDIRDTLSSAKECLSYVAEKLKVHGNAIAKRWTKKSVSKRAAMLRAATSEMQKRPCAAAGLFYLQKREDVDTWKRFHEEWLMPSLDVETLSQDPSKLLALLHYRTHHSLEDWFLFDCHQLRSPFSEGALEVGYNPHCVVVHGEHYGELKQWDKAGAHRWDIVGFPRAQVTFEAQERIAQLLKAMVEMLLEVQAPEGNGKWLALLASDFNRSRTQGGLSYALGQRFRAPPSLDLDGISEILQSRLHAAEDSLYEMQTEPGHVRKLLERAKSSRWMCGQENPIQQQQLLRMAVGPLDRYERFECTARDARCSLSAHDEYVGRLALSHDLSQQYDQTILLFRASLEALFSVLKFDLRGLTAMSSAFQHHYCYCLTGHPHLRIGPAQAYRVDPLFWYIYQLHEYDDEGPFDREMLLSCLSDTLSGAGKKEASRVDRLLRNHLEDMAAVSEALIALHYRPCVSGKLSQAECIEFARSSEDWADWDLRCAANTMMLKRMGDFLYQPLELLLSSKSSVETVEWQTEVYMPLSDFWSRAYHCKGALLEEGGVSKEKQTRYPESISICWTDSKKAESSIAALDRAVVGQGRKSRTSLPERLSKPRSSTAALERIPTPITPIQTVWGSEENPEAKDYTPKAKVKTRPVKAPTEPPSPVTDLLAEPTNVTKRPSISVTTTSLDLFQRIFTPIATAKNTACVAWDDLVAALIDAGCWMEQRGGSAVSFTQDDKSCGAVTIHRPHPDSRVNPIMLKDCARKVEKYFGWDKDMFVKRAKTTS